MEVSAMELASSTTLGHALTKEFPKMSWWKRLWSNGRVNSVDERISGVELTMPGWKEEAPQNGRRLWRDLNGDVVSLTALPESEFPDLAATASIEKWARPKAEASSAGLIEAKPIATALGAGLYLIYKRLRIPAYTYTLMLIVPSKGHFWCVVCAERGMTGVREAVVTAELMNAGKLTFESYATSWASDPFDPNYKGVDTSVLRFLSDDESYDERFPDHPLSKIRQILKTLPGSMQLSEEA